MFVCSVFCANFPLQPGAGAPFEDGTSEEASYSSWNARVLVSDFHFQGFRIFHTHRIHGAGIYAHIGGILVGSMLPYIAYMDPMGYKTSRSSISYDFIRFSIQHCPCFAGPFQ